MPSKRVLITGLEGFTGRYLSAELLSAGYEIFGTIKSGDPAPNRHPCDLLETAKLSQYIKMIKPDYIVNLAGISFVEHGSSAGIYTVNQLGVLSLLEAIVQSQHTPSKILLTSSAHIYGNQGSALIDETCSPKPNSDYAVSKLAMETLASLWFQRLPILIVRPFNYTGVGQSPIFLPSKIVSHFKARAQSIELGNLDVARDWSDVRDIVSTYRYLIESAHSGVIVNVCSGVSHTLQYIIDMLSEISGHVINVRVNNEFVRQNEIKYLNGSNRLLASMISSYATRPLKETLSWMLFN